MQFFRFKSLLFLVFLFIGRGSIAQEVEQLSFFEPAPSFHPKRFWISLGTGATLYTGAVIGLNEIWYADFPRSSFQLFNDWGEWQDMDKAGHFFTTYMESNWIFGGARWVGLERRKAMWTAVGMASLFQATIEVMDGFSEKWGFSIPDITFNTAGALAFVGQEMLWQEQRIIFKVSSYHSPYPDDPIISVDGNSVTTLRQRANSLYGGGAAASFLKDYNAQTLWASVNVHAFLNNKESKFPKWLNLAVGYGAENMYGGFENRWEEDGASYILDSDLYPRYRQFYLSLDIDLTRIKTKNRFLKTLFSAINIIKIPAPALEINTLGKVKFHPVFF
ncbi:MAG: DUF2279 domain-containing protein [Saprospiraceae bacterium]